MEAVLCGVGEGEAVLEIEVPNVTLLQLVDDSYHLTFTSLPPGDPEPICVVAWLRFSFLTKN